MKVSDLHYFVEVVEHGSLTQAAEVLDISQPGLSRIVRELERQVGTLLLQRTGRGIELTDGGELFLEFARNTVERFDQVQRDLAALSPKRPTRLQIAIPIGTGTLLAPALQRRFALELPKTAIDVFEERTARATDAMLMRRYDFVMTYGYGADIPAEGEDLYAEDLYLVGVGDLAGEDADTITMDDIARMPLLLPPAGRFRSLIDRSFTAAGLRPEVAREFETSEAMLAYVMEREGVAILPYTAVIASHAPSRLTARVIVSPRITRTIRLLSSPLLRAETRRTVLQILRVTLDNLAPRVDWRKIRPTAP